MTKGKTDNRRPEVQQIGEDSYTDYLAKQAAELDKLSFNTIGQYSSWRPMIRKRPVISVIAGRSLS